MKVTLSDKVKAAEALHASMQKIEMEQLELADQMTSMMLKQHLLAKRYAEVRSFLEKLVPAHE